MKTKKHTKTVLSICVCGILFLGSISEAISQTVDRFVYRYRLKAEDQSSENKTFVIPDASGLLPATYALSSTTSFGVDSATELSASEFAILVTPSYEPIGVLPATVLPGQQYRVIAAAPDAYGKQNTISFTLGDMTGKWTVASQLFDVTPDKFSLDDNPFLPSKQFESQISVTPTGYEAATDIFITTDKNAAEAGNPSTVNAAVAALSVNGGPWSGRLTIRPGQSVKVRALSAGLSSAVSYYIGVVGENNGGMIASVNFNTLPAKYIPTVPNPIYTYGAQAGTSVVSEIISPTGFNVPIAINIGESSYPGVVVQVSVDGAAWSANATIQPGQSFRLKLNVPADAFDLGGAMLNVIYSVGNRTGLAWFIQS
jgi:hypothetical protein